MSKSEQRGYIKKLLNTCKYVYLDGSLCQACTKNLILCSKHITKNLKNLKTNCNVIDCHNLTSSMKGYCKTHYYTPKTKNNILN